MFFADFVTFEGDRDWTTVDVKAGNTRVESVSTMPVPTEQFASEAVSE